MPNGWRSQADGPGGLTDALSTSNGAETEVIGHGEGAGMYLAIGDAKHVIEVMDGVESHADTSTGHGDTPSVETDMIKPANETKTISIPRKKVKPPDLPVVAATCAPEVSNGDRDLAEGLTVHSDTYSIETETEKTENEMAIIRTRQNSSQTRDLLYTVKIETATRTYQWRRVSIEDVNVYLPWNALIVVPRQQVVCGEAESRVEAIAPNVEGKRACDGDGDRNGDGGDNGGDGGEGSTTSGGSVDLVQVNSALLAVKSQYMCQN